MVLVIVGLNMETRPYLRSVLVSTYELFSTKTWLLIFFIYGQRGLPTRASKLDTTVSVQDLAVQSQALFNIKDSSKVRFQGDVMYINTEILNI